MRGFTFENIIVNRKCKIVKRKRLHLITRNHFIHNNIVSFEDKEHDVRLSATEHALTLLHSVLLLF